jgi:hypothetical protein
MANCTLCGRPEAEAPPEQHRCHAADVCDKDGDCPWCVIACRDAQIRILKVRNEYLAGRIGVEPTT